MNIGDLGEYALLIPIGVIGVWRWSIWLFKKTCALFYRPMPAVDHHYGDTTLSLVVPVYNENPQVLKAALDSWRANKPDEIIAVIDFMDHDCIKVFLDFAKSEPGAKLLVTAKEGKRAALVDGIRQANSEIVALVDSDVIWAPGVANNGLAPFSDPKIGGVVARQNCVRPHSIWQKILDIMWDSRNTDEWPSQTAMGGVLTCLSGRTAFYRRQILLPHLDYFQNEIIFGRRKESGDDKCLTRIIQRNGWHSYYQSKAQVYSTATSSFKVFWRQRIRWSRNSYGSDITALFVERWVWKHPYLAFYMIDRFISPFTLSFALVIFFLALSQGHWITVLVILTWWMISRTIKILPHLARRPQDILMVPAYAGVSFLIAAARIYAMITVREQKWIRDRELEARRQAK